MIRDLYNRIQKKSDQESMRKPRFSWKLESEKAGCCADKLQDSGCQRRPSLCGQLAGVES